MNTIKTITNNEEYKQALTRLEQIFDAKKGSPEGEELEQLGILIEEYEDKHYPIEPPSQ